MRAQSCSTLGDFMDCSLPHSSVHEIFQARNTGVGCHFPHHWIFPTQGLNPHLPHGQADSLPLRPLGSLQRKCLICTHTHKHAHTCTYGCECACMHTHTNTYTRWNIYLSPKFIYLLFIPEKEGNPAVCNNMNEPGGYYNQ